MTEKLDAADGNPPKDAARHEPLSIERFNQELLNNLGEFKKMAHALARKFSHIDADDLLQETFARALRKRHLYQPEKGAGGIRPWFMTLMKNRGIDMYRANKIFRDAADFEAHAFKTGKAGAQEALADVEHAMERLELVPEPFRSTFVKAVIEEEGAAATAAALGLPEGTVSSRIRKVRAFLRDDEHATWLEHRAKARYS